MKKFSILLLSVFAVISCKGEAPFVNVQSVTLDKHYVEVKVGDKIQLNASVLPDNATDKSLRWWTNNVDFTCTGGLVSSSVAGIATVTASNGQMKDTCRVVAYEGTITRGSKTYPVTKASIDIGSPDPDYPGTETFALLLSSDTGSGIEHIQMTIPKMYLGQTIDLAAVYPAIPSNGFPQWAVHSFLNNNENLIGTYYVFGEEQSTTVNNNWEPQEYKVEKGTLFIKLKSNIGYCQAKLDITYSNGVTLKADWDGKASLVQF